VEKRIVERAFLNEFDEIIAVEWRFVIKAHGDCTFGSDNSDVCGHRIDDVLRLWGFKVIRS
jgi:hypothetical protein